MHPKYPRIFSPIKLGPIELSNRFYMSPHSVPMAVGTKPSDDFIHYYVARVKGGCGLVMLAATLHGRARIFQPSPHPKENIGAFRALADAVHEAGGKNFRGTVLPMGGCRAMAAFEPTGSCLRPLPGAVPES